MTDAVVITNTAAALSNLVLNLLLPPIADFAQRLDLPEKACSPTDVRAFHKAPRWGVEGAVTFKTGNRYVFTHGYVSEFCTPHAYYGLQDPALIPKLYGSVNMTRSEAIAAARAALGKLGYSEESLYADLEPEVLMPETNGTSIIPRFLVTWPAANKGLPSAQMEINAAERRIESIALFNLSLQREPPALPGSKPRDTRPVWQRLSNTNDALISEALPKMNRFVRLVSLPIELPVTPGTIEGSVFHLPDLVDARIKLTNGFVFKMKEGTVVGFDAPDVFFTWEHEVCVKAFQGKAKLSEAEAVNLVRAAVKKLGYPGLLVAARPEIQRPYGQARSLVPRYLLQWDCEAKGLDGSTVLGEVDASSGTIKSLLIILRPHSP